MSNESIPFPHYKTSRGNLLYVENPEGGTVTLNGKAGPISIDLVAHVFEGESKPIFLGLLLHSAQMFALLKEVQDQIGTRKSIGKNSKLGIAIPALLQEMEETMNRAR